ncbi:MAG TPA: hypothetical protein VLH85_04400 [Levilinea sp.]|nr:hypothetical protein [Levilinea sp.]
MRSPIAASVAIGIGLIVLAGYFVRIPLLVHVQTLLLGWAVILAGVALLVGILNLVRVHWNKMRNPRDRERDPYSVVLLIAFAVTLVAGLILTPLHEQYRQVVLSIQAPVEISLLAILAISLVYACLSLYQRRGGYMASVFVASVVFFLLVSSGIFGDPAAGPLSSGFYGTLNRLPVAGARGILLGIALGSITTGLRILLGADRPYSG